MILWQKSNKQPFCDENVMPISELKVINGNVRILFSTHFHHKILMMLLICSFTYSSQNFHSSFLLHFCHKITTFWSICGDTNCHNFVMKMCLQHMYQKVTILCWKCYNTLKCLKYFFFPQRTTEYWKNYNILDFDTSLGVKDMEIFDWIKVLI